MTVLDASAVLALIHDEPGAEQVAQTLPTARLGAANLAEVIGKLVDAKVDVSRVRGLLTAAGVTIEPGPNSTYPSPSTYSDNPFDSRQRP